jgi:hypothetical protein
LSNLSTRCQRRKSILRTQYHIPTKLWTVNIKNNTTRKKRTKKKWIHIPLSLLRLLFVVVVGNSSFCRGSMMQVLWFFVQIVPHWHPHNTPPIHESNF